MWDSFIAWGQAYGLWATVGLLVFVYIFEYIDCSKAKKALEEERKTAGYYKKQNDLLLKNVRGDEDEPPPDDS
ncbi:hypothetical protein [Ruminococcus sp.]|uniref:hypothetical protein n=1 Tax=Ruminococcus sp. TaxID=41978 RepID=UPI0025E3F277|nr:hypothetical protein [Ruminococcus sp.]MBQ8966263.1 hypothetical protein [Ruminococcus sp.]